MATLTNLYSSRCSLCYWSNNSGKKGLRWNEKRKEKKHQEGPNRRIRRLEKQIKELRHILAWTSNEIHRREIKRKSTKKKKKILQKLKKNSKDQQLNRNDELIYVKEKALDKLRYPNIQIKCIKIKHARICNNNVLERPRNAL